MRQIYKSQLYAGTEFFISNEHPFYTILRDTIRVAQQEGTIRSDVSAAKLVHIVINCGRGMIYDWCLHNGDFNLEKKMTSQFTIIIQGLQKAQ